MRLPLLIHGKPSTLKSGECARVTLPSGGWTIEHDVVDSKVFIHVRRPTPVIYGGTAQMPEEYLLNGKRHGIEGNCSVQVIVQEAGSEKHISVYAESVK
jgi:hypothetical protein